MNTISADFNNADAQGRLRLICQGTLDDLRVQRLELHEGLRVVVRDDDLRAEATVTWSETEGMWVAVIDWNAIEELPES